MINHLRHEAASAQARGRFAPTPSGRLHVGSARTAIAAELLARARGGAFVLRVEDLDSTRMRAADTPRMFEDLKWLGVTWDEGPDCGGPSQPYLQSQRFGLYVEALELLREKGLAYPCVCSRREVEQASNAPHGAESVYPGTCAHAEMAETMALAKARNRPVCWRFRTRAGTVTAHDSVLGTFAQDVSQDVGDFVLMRADGVPAYQLAVVVDDITMRIDHVVRGADLLASTPRQLLLYEAFNAPPPSYAHIPLVVDATGERLAKRLDSLALETLRAQGVEGSALRAQLERSLGVENGTLRVEAIPKEPLHVETLFS